MTQNSKLCNAAFLDKYNIQHIRKYLKRMSNESLVHAFIASRLDYGNSLLCRLPQYLIQKLQHVQNAFARLIYNSLKHCHITPLLNELHSWLPAHTHIIFLCFSPEKAPRYIIDPISVMPSNKHNLHLNSKAILFCHVLLQSSGMLFL